VPRSRATRLGLKFKSHAQFVAALVEVLDINERGQCQSDALLQLLLKAQTKLRSIVDLGSDGGVGLKLVPGAKAETSGVRASRPGQLHTSLQLVIDLLVEGTTKLSAIIAADKKIQSNEVRKNLI